MRRGLGSLNILQRVVNLVRRFRDAQSCLLSDMLNCSNTLNLLLDSFKMVDVDMLRGRVFHRELVDLGINSLNVKTCRQLQVPEVRQQ